ncbi:MAG: hypothetical protein HQK50_11940 [Oligoflexia bacterium]|nr:hypothetical protein [Oligoflexia bacterium]MBF0366275.1 hypothetical protein [Oligoflexia bacterium]
MEKTILSVLKLIENILGHSIINDPVWSKSIELFLNEELKHAGLKDCTEYMNLLLSNDIKLNQFIHKVLIHKTRWFREDFYLSYLQNIFDTLKQKHVLEVDFNVLSVACSTGQEVYSLGLYLEHIKRKMIKVNYQLTGIDIDVYSLNQAENAMYSLDQFKLIPQEYHCLLKKIEDGNSGSFSIDQEIRKCCDFLRFNIYSDDFKALGKYDLILCRNVLIYFEKSTALKIVENMYNVLNDRGIIVFGSSESMSFTDLGLENIRPNIYQKKIKKIDRSTQDVSKANPTVIANLNKDEQTIPKRKISRIKALTRPEVILIGSSTGGVSVLNHILKEMPNNCPPIVVVQHIEESFASTFAQNLAETAKLKLITENKNFLKPGHLYCSPGDYHIELKNTGSGILFLLSKLSPRKGHRPCIDILFKSATLFAEHTMAIILTGMGQDGADGMESLFTNGAYTMVQDEQSSVVFGMPKEALNRKCVHFCGDIEELRLKIITAIAA